MSTKQRRDTYIIEDGPNRETLFDALKYAYDEGVTIPIEFVMSYEKSTQSECIINVITRNTKVTGIDHENGSGKSFIVRGLMQVCFYPEIPCCDDLNSNFSKCHFTACYDTETKSGRINLLEY